MNDATSFKLIVSSPFYLFITVSSPFFLRGVAALSACTFLKDVDFGWCTNIQVNRSLKL